MEYIEGVVAELNLHVTGWEGNIEALKDLVTRANSDTLRMVHTVAKLMKDSSAKCSTQPRLYQASDIDFQDVIVSRNYFILMNAYNIYRFY